MKKSVVIRKKSLKPIVDLNFDYKIFLYFILFVCGLIIGITIIKNASNDTCQLLFGVIKRHLIALKGCSYLNNICSVFLSLLIVLFYIFVFGQCSIGIPFIGVAPLLWGVFTGIGISCYYSMFSFNGLSYFTIVNLPCYAITAATLVKGCCISTRMSNEIFLSLLSGEWKKQEDNTIKQYCISFLILLIPLLISAIMKSGSHKLFSGLFNLV